MSTRTFTPEEEAHYGALADAAERGELAPAQTVFTGQQATKESQRFFTEMFGTADPQELLEINPTGRPRLDQAQKKKGPSPTINLRLSEEMRQAIEELARRRHQNKSEVIRFLVLEGLKHAS